MVPKRKREQPQGPGPAQAPVSTCVQPKPFILSSFTVAFCSPCFSGEMVGQVDGPSDCFFSAKLSLAPGVSVWFGKDRVTLAQAPSVLSSSLWVSLYTPESARPAFLPQCAMD